MSTTTSPIIRNPYPQVDRALLGNLADTPLFDVIRKAGEDGEPFAVAVLPAGQSQARCNYCETTRLVSENCNRTMLHCRRCDKSQPHALFYPRLQAEEIRSQLGLLRRLGVDVIEPLDTDSPLLGDLDLWIDTDSRLTGRLRFHPRLLPNAASRLLHFAARSLTDPAQWHPMKWHPVQGRDGVLWLGYEWRLARQSGDLPRQVLSAKADRP